MEIRSMTNNSMTNEKLFYLLQCVYFDNIDSVVLLAGLVGDPIAKKYPKITTEINLNGIFNVIKVSASPCDYASNESSTTFQSICKLELCQFSCFGGQSPKYGNLAQTSKFWGK